MSHLFEYFATSDDEDPTPTVDAKQLPGDLTLSTVCFLVYSTLRHRPEVKCLSGLSTKNVFEVPGCTLLELCSIVDSKRGESQTTGIYTQSSSQSTPKQVGNVDSSYGRPSVSVRLRPCSTRTATSVIGPGSSARLGFLFPFLGGQLGSRTDRGATPSVPKPTPCRGLDSRGRSGAAPVQVEAS